MGGADVEKKFRAAVSVIQNLPQDGPYQPSNEMKLNFYAHYKQATIGPCKQARPSFWDPIGRAKHDAWASLGNMNSVTAMEGYVNLLFQIVETMNMTPEVEKFMDVVGPFYEFVDDDLLERLNLPPKRSATSLKEDRNNTSLPPVDLLLSNGDGRGVEVPGVPHPDDSLDADQNLDAMLGRYIPPKEELQFQREFEDDLEFADQGLDGLDEPFLQEMMAASRDLQRTQQLMAEVKQIRASHQSIQADRSHGNVRSQSLDRMSNNSIDVHQHTSRNNIQQTRNSANNRQGEEKRVSLANGTSGDGRMSQAELDRLLDRYDGYVSKSGAEAGQIKMDSEANGQPSGRREVIQEDQAYFSLDSVQKSSSATMDRNSPLDQSDSEDDLFEDSIDYPLSHDMMNSHLRTSDYGEDSLRLSTEKFNLQQHSSSIHSPNISEMKSMAELIKAEEEDQILIVRRNQRIEDSVTTSPALDRFVVAAVDQLNHDLQSLENSFTQITSRVNNIDSKIAQVTSRLSNIEYLLQIVIAKQESQGEKMMTYLGLPMMACAAFFLFKMIISFRKTGR